jgi:hypothetical protein
MGVATTCHESRIAATSHNVEKQAGPARPLSRASKPSLHKYVIRIPVVHEFFPITVLPPASGHAALASQKIVIHTAGTFPSKLDEGDRGCKELSLPITE